LLIDDIALDKPYHLRGANHSGARAKGGLPHRSQNIDPQFDTAASCATLQMARWASLIAAALAEEETVTTMDN
jgi:hypothetical protein